MRVEVEDEFAARLVRGVRPRHPLPDVRLVLNSVKFDVQIIAWQRGRLRKRAIAQHERKAQHADESE